jgi:iturin family lipopeptide synthetase B
MEKPGKIQDVYSLTPMQEGMLFHSLANPDSQMYHELFSVRLKAALNISAMEESLQTLVKRHDILRTVFLYKNVDKPKQVVLKERKSDFTYVDIRHFSNRDEKEIYISNYKEKDRARTFDLSKHILFRMALLQIENDEFELYILHHHIILDGWSTGIFFKEFFSIYNQINNGKPDRLLPATPFKQYINYLNNKDKDATKNFWQEYLAGYDNQAIIPGRPGYHEFKTTYKQNSQVLIIDTSKSQTLNRITSNNELTLNSIMKAIWGILLAKYNQQDDVVFGTVVSGRPSEIDGIEDMIGLFINTVPTRIKIYPNMTFLDLFKGTHHHSASVQEHHYFALTDILNESELKRNLFNHILAFENYPVDSDLMSDAGKMKVENVNVYEQANYGLSIIIMPGNKITVHFVYNEQEYDDFIIANVLSSYSCILEQMLSNPYMKIKDVELISESEKNIRLHAIHEVKRLIDETVTISGMIEKQARTHPERNAVVEFEKKLTFRQLDEESSKVARFLVSRGIGHGSFVGVMTHQSIYMAIAMNGILKTGAAFLPIDSNYPEKRIEYMITDSGVNIILYDDESYPERNNVEMVNIHEILMSGNQSIFPDEAISTDNAYVIYTSGSTGQPKGVAITHRSAVNLLTCHIDTFGFNPQDICLELFSFSFDAFILSFFTPLCSGGSVVLIKDEDRGDPAKVAEYIGNYKVTNINCIPTLFNGIAHHITESQAVSLRLVQLGGDKVERASLDVIVKKNKTVEIAQEYGVTEAAVASTIQRNQQIEPVLKIGKPIWNAYVYTLDQHKKMLPVGIPGELHIGGIGISSGYINNEQLTSEKFIKNPFRADEMLYCTGDIGRYCEDGAVQFLRRKDKQVKIRGFRIEIDEIQSALKKHTDIIESAVICKAEKSGNNSLFAYIVPKQHLEVRAIREFLTGLIPVYMIPSYFIEMEKLPVTPNGKVDINNLKQRKDEIVSTVKFSEPKTEIEKLLVNLWQEVLGIERIGTTDDFFALGGDSIKSIQIRSRLNRLEYDLELSLIFQNPTIVELAKHVTSSAMVNENIEDITTPMFVMPGQQRYLTNTFEKGDKPINAGLFSCEIPMSQENYEQIITKIYMQHDALKMRFYSSAYGFSQKGSPTVPATLFSQVKNIDIHDDSQLERLVIKIGDTFDIEQGPLLSTIFFPEEQKSHILIIAHQSLIDFNSFKVLFEDIGILVHQILNKTTLKLPPVSNSYKKLLESLKSYFAGDASKKDMTYWNTVADCTYNYADRSHNKDTQINKTCIEISQCVSEFITGKVNKAFNTDIEDILLAVCMLTVNNVFPEKSGIFHIENSSRGPFIDGINNSRICGSFQTGYPLYLNTPESWDLSKTIKEIKEIMHKVPMYGLPYMVRFSKADTADLYANDKRSPSFAFNLTRLDWTHSEHLSFKPVINPNRVFIAANKSIDIAFDWIIEIDKLYVNLYYYQSVLNEEVLKKLIESIKDNFNSISDYCLNHGAQELTPSDFTFKGVSLDEFDSIESFFGN